MAKSKLSLKLLIDTKAKKVLFAEVDKDCADFLFYILSLPVAKLITLVGKQSMVGSLGNLYGSIENMKESYLLPNKSKADLLEPPRDLLAIRDASFSSKFSSSTTVTKMMYACATCLSRYGRNYCVSDGPGAACPYCANIMGPNLKYVAPPNSTATPKKELCEDEGGFVKGVVTYMVMDDLVVKPMSAISSITLLKQFNVKDVGVLEEEVVTMGMDEAVKLLKASMETNKVLTTVFVKGKWQI